MIKDDQPGELETLLTLDEVIAYVRVSGDTIARLVARGEFPAPIEISPRLRRWRKQDLIDWLAQQSQKER